MLFTLGQRVSEGKIVLPDFLRAALGLHDPTTFNIVPTQPVQHPVIELLASTIPRNAWHDVWRLEVTFHDRDGLIADLSLLLQSNSCRILSTRATTTAAASLICVDVDFDASQYDSDVDGSPEIRENNPVMALLELEAQIAVKFINDLVILPQSRALLAIRRNLVLFDGANIAQPTHQAIVQSSLLDLSGLLPDLRDADRIRPICYLVADETHLALRIYLVEPNKGFCHFRVLAHNRSKSVSRICKGLRDRGFNICQIYMRTKSNFEICVADFLVGLIKPRSRLGEAELEERLDKAVQALPKWLNCTIQFPSIFDPNTQSVSEFCRRSPYEAKSANSGST